MTRSDLSLAGHGDTLAAWHYPAQTDAWTTAAGRPCIVMAHGFGATKDAGLTPFAERFAAAGADVVIFDYRGFGTSGGSPRQNVDHRRHRDDYRSVVSQVRGLVGIDPDRIVLWGSSYSGGHVVAVAARDPRVAAVVSQGAAMDGLAAVVEIIKYAGLGQLLRLTAHAVRGVVQRTYTIPIVAAPGELAAITSHDALSGYEIIMGPTFENRMLARGILPILINRPVASAAKLAMPLMLVVAASDTIAPPSAVERVATKTRGRVEVERFDVGHFDIYQGETFEKSISAQVEFLASVFATRTNARSTGTR